MVKFGVLFRLLAIIVCVKDPACLALDVSIALSVLVGAFKTINLSELDTLCGICASEPVSMISCMLNVW